MLQRSKSLDRILWEKNQTKRAFFVEYFVFLLAMKGVTVFLPVAGYLREWLTSRFGNPVRLPARSYEQEVLRRCVSRTPKGWMPLPQDGQGVAVVLPDDDMRRPETYCYLGRRGADKLRAALTALFSIDLWQGMQVELLRRGGLNAVIEEWCRERGISPQHREAVRQRFYRMRCNYAAFGVAVGKKYRKVRRDGGGLCT